MGEREQKKETKKEGKREGGRETESVCAKEQATEGESLVRDRKTESSRMIHRYYMTLYIAYDIFSVRYI